MSLFVPMTVKCPSCDHPITMEAVGSVNADRRPDYRDDILENTFQDIACEKCGETFRMEPEFIYLDAGRGQWIASLPFNRMRDHLDEETGTQAIFDQSFGPQAPQAAQAVGDALTVRVTFGWPAVREKIFVKELGLDDAVVELLKMDLLRRLPEAPLSEGVELRLVGSSDQELTFAWIDAMSEGVISDFSANKQLYDDIEAAEKDWAPIRAQLTDGPFVDMQKLFMGQGRA